MNRSLWWPTSYFASRERFVADARAFGADITSHEIAATGAQGESLSIDVASRISPDDTHRVVIISGVHGVEGFIGACVQIEAMKRLRRHALSDGVGIVMIHAVNPWGFAHLRRVNEDNIDLNRNFEDRTAIGILNARQHCAAS